MKHAIAIACLAGAFSLLLSAVSRADGWGSASERGQNSPSAVSRTLQQIDAGTKRFVRGTVDVITLKPLRKSKKPSLPLPEKPWENKPKHKQQEKKKSFWSGLFPAKEEPKRVETMKDFVGLPRPS